METFRLLSVENKKLHLLCTGKSFKADELKKIERLGLTRKVKCFHVNELELGQLYQQALLFVYPSLYEGFGIPILEAFVNECPVALSNTSSFPEVAGNAGEYFDPRNPESIYDTVNRLLKDTGRRQYLIEAGCVQARKYTWQQTARQTEKSYRLCLQNY